jgi:hypothetical protein
MLNIWFTADFHLGHKNIIRYYSLCAEALFYLNRCLRQLPSTSCLHPSELMHANTRHDRGCGCSRFPDIPFSWTRATPRYKLDIRQIDFLDELRENHAAFRRKVSCI